MPRMHKNKWKQTKMSIQLSLFLLSSIIHCKKVKWNLTRSCYIFPKPVLKTGFLKASFENTLTDTFTQIHTYTNVHE